MSKHRVNWSVDMNKKKLRTHKLYTIKAKLEIIKCFEKAEYFAPIERFFDINKSTIC